MDIAYVAKLANLPLTVEEEKTFSEQMPSIIEYVDQLQKLDMSNVVAPETGETNIMREDKVEECPPIISGFIKTKAIFNND